jgi:plasmid stability protein
LPKDIPQGGPIHRGWINRSTEAEIRAILEEAVLPAVRVKLGTAMREIARAHDVSNADVEALEQALERRAPADPPACGSSIHGNTDRDTTILTPPRRSV